MQFQTRTDKIARTFGSICLLSLSLCACSELKNPKTEPFYSQTSPPAKQEFRWSNGQLPKSFDPAIASAAPETDVVRALFEGLTELDPKTLQEIPGVAEKWTASDDLKTWTFYLREDAKWSNGKAVTAQDFVRSWRRLAQLREKGAHSNLLNNIVGLPLEKPETPDALPNPPDFLSNTNTNQNLPVPSSESNVSTPLNNTTSNTNSVKTPIEKPLGFVAEGERVLKVSLIRPDKDFPKLAANPIFRPVYGDAKEFESEKLNAGIVTNGAFRISAIAKDGITLQRSENYWDRTAIKLESIRFVPAENAENALEAYRAGHLDAITNVEFSPLVLKLLSPYDDFRKTAHSALNFYEVNFTKPPFADRRVRRALSAAIDRERLTEGEMEGATQAALSFLPYGGKGRIKLSQDKETARKLLDEAGFPNGENFPVIKLIVNRNDTQQRVARSVAKMWKQNLNLEAEIIVKEPSELESAVKSGEFDLARRGVVLPTADETANFMAIFGFRGKTEDSFAENGDKKSIENANNDLSNPQAAESSELETANQNSEAAYDEIILNEEDAVYELRAIPLYFPTSYSLVKPYVSGFEMNSFGAPSLRDVMIDNNWQPKKVLGES